MKKITIKVLILSLSMLVVPNIKCTPPVAAVILSGLQSIFIVGSVGIALGVGTAAFVGYKVIRHISLTPEQRAEIKREKLEARKKRMKVLVAKKERRVAKQAARKQRKADKLEVKNKRKAERIAQKKAKKMKLSAVIKKEDVTQEVLFVSAL